MSMAMSASHVQPTGERQREQSWPWLPALLLALLAHGLAWSLWRQHAGAASTAHMAAPVVSLRLVSGSPAQSVRQVSRPPSAAPVQPHPQLVLKAAHHTPLNAPAAHAVAPSDDGPVMVDSSFDDALQAVSARDQQAAAGNAQDPFAINPDAYWPADTLDQAPQLAGPWQLNEAAVPHRAPGQPTAVTIALRLWVSPEGHIDAVQVISADPDLPWIESLLQNIHQTELRPAYQQGRAVAASWLVEWQLDLSGGL